MRTWRLSGLRPRAVLLGMTVLAIVLCGCQALLGGQGPPATWMPLPTLGPALTDTSQPGVTAVPAMPQATAAATAAATGVVTAATSSAATGATAQVAPTMSPTRMPTATPSETAKAKDPATTAAWARDLAWTALRETYPDDQYVVDPDWQSGDVDALLGATHYHYDAGNWHLSVAVPVLPLGSVSYQVLVSGAKGFAWEALVDAEGAVTSEAPDISVTDEPIEGWRGTLHSLPQDSPFDDYLNVIGENAGQYGIDSQDDALRVQLADLRDSGRTLIVSGTLRRDAPDHGDVLIIVERLKLVPLPATPVPATVPAPVPASEFVEAWVGVVRVAPAGAAYDDYFDAQHPGGQYGIAALVARTAEEIVSYRESGATIRIWGILDHGVADHGGTRIVISRMEAVNP